MTSSRTTRVLMLVAEAAAGRGGTADVRDVCTAAVLALPIDGASLSAVAAPALRHVLHTTDAISTELEELQLTLGEGPCVDAISTHHPVLSGDLSAPAAEERWPAFAPAACEAGARAMIALPLESAAAAPAVLDLYRAEAGQLAEDELSDALAFASLAAMLLPLATPDVTGFPDSGPAGYDGYRAEIDQAVGMLTEQLDVGVEEAALRLRAYAYACSQRVADVAGDVVARRLRFHPDGTSRAGMRE